MDLTCYLYWLMSRLLQSQLSLAFKIKPHVLKMVVFMQAHLSEYGLEIVRDKA